MAVAVGVLAPLTAARAAIVVTDTAGRAVRLAAPAQRIVMSDALDLVAFSLIDREPAARIVGWSRSRLDDALYRQFVAHDPRIGRIPDLGVMRPNAVPLEKIISLQPDLVVFGSEFTADDPAVKKLEATGIPVAIIGVGPSLRRPGDRFGPVILGRLVGREAQGREYEQFFQSRVARIAERVKDVSDRPAVLLEAHAGGGACCMSPGRGESIGDFVDLARGENIGADVIPGMAGQLSLEYVLRRDPAIYIGTGGPYMAARGGLVLGAGVGEDEAAKALAKAATRTGFPAMTAVREGRVHGVAHTLTTSGLNLVAIEAVAKWVRPDLFRDVDPAATLREIEDRFLGFRLSGTFLASTAQRDGER